MKVEEGKEGRVVDGERGPRRCERRGVGGKALGVERGELGSWVRRTVTEGFTGNGVISFR